MGSRQITFHGDIDDLTSIFEDWFSDDALFFVPSLGELNQEIKPMCTPEQAIDLLLKPGSTSSPLWLIAESGTDLRKDVLVMKDGSGTKERVSLSNRALVGIRFGGVTDAWEMQPSVLSVSGDNEQANKLYKKLAKSIIVAATPMADCLILPGARKKLNNGWRLPRGQFNSSIADIKD